MANFLIKNHQFSNRKDLEIFQFMKHSILNFNKLILKMKWIQLKLQIKIYFYRYKNPNNQKLKKSKVFSNQYNYKQTLL